MYTYMAVNCWIVHLYILMYLNLLCKDFEMVLLSSVCTVVLCCTAFCYRNRYHDNCLFVCNCEISFVLYLHT